MEAPPIPLPSTLPISQPSFNMPSDVLAQLKDADGSPLLDMRDVFGTDDISFGWVPVLLSQVVSPIKTVGFYLWEGDAEGLNSVAWEQIAQLLASERYRTMTRLQVHVWGRPKETAPMKKKVRELLAFFDDTGVLEIDDLPDPACCI